jgi:hypothetical protein
MSDPAPSWAMLRAKPSRGHDTADEQAGSGGADWWMGCEIAMDDPCEVRTR